jgi:hypothetical protein
MKVIISELQKHKLLELDIHIFDDLLFENDIEETWSKKYKKSINCNNPKGFSQKAHCQARKKRQRGQDTKSKSPFK